MKHREVQVELKKFCRSHVETDGDKSSEAEESGSEGDLFREKELTLKPKITNAGFFD